ncbi:MAG: cytochrome c maturation protein CcmE [Phycisphaeraceae bacterium]|nr:cytochrome c maturation protein CcmE [Phycisphaeraceae bacterium]
MNHRTLKLAFGALVLVLALGYLAVSGVREGWVYYVTIDQLSDSDQIRGRRTRLTGNVAKQGIEIAPGRLDAKFILAGNVNRLPVTYHGVIPDMFRANAQVIVTGRLNDQNVFVADELMTQCASKYQSAKPPQHPNVDATVQPPAPPGGTSESPLAPASSSTPAPQGT